MLSLFPTLIVIVFVLDKTGTMAQEQIKPITQAMPCHAEMNAANLANDAGLADIDNALTDLYTAIDTSADYMDECNHTVTFDNEETNVTILFEQFELERFNYQHGFWGYCAKAGADDLVSKIKAFKDFAKDKSLRTCDRNKLLGCHAKFSRCICMIDNRDFRNIASNFWNDTQEASEDPDNSIGQSQCVLISGSDCPLSEESPFLCIPGTTCLFKRDMSPCTTSNKNNTITALSRQKRTADNSTSSGGHNMRLYSFANDHFPTVHCQCYGYEKRLQGGGSIPWEQVAGGKMLVLQIVLHLMRAMLYGQFSV